jgi:hypothetical protein
MNKYACIAIFLSLLISSENIALYSIKKFAINPINYNWLILCSLIYGLTIPPLLYKMLTYEGIGMINFFWNIFSTLSGFMIGILLFSEAVTHLQWIGIVLSMVGIGLVILSDYKK